MEDKTTEYAFTNFSFTDSFNELIRTKCKRDKTKSVCVLFNKKSLPK